MATIRLLPDGREVDCRDDRPILETLEAAGHPLPNDCRAGHCGTCRIRLRSGDVDRGLYMPMALSDEDAAEGYLLSCVATPVTPVVELEYGAAVAAAALGVELFAPRTDVEFVVTDKIARTPGIVEVRLRPVGRRLKYWPGQYVVLGPRDGGGLERPYSIANPPRPDGEITLHVARVSGGVTSTWVHEHLSLGDPVTVAGPYGSFVGDLRMRGPVVALAGGSGLAPVLALTEAALRRGYEDPVTVLHSARTPDDLYATGLLGHLCRSHPNFRYVRTVTRPDTRVAGTRTGRVPEILRGVTGSLAEANVFVAGSPGFVAACGAAARALGAGAGRVHVETFFPRSPGGRPPDRTPS
ncbi:MAG: 2Fe-2S iron-sulfur cluster-binding protein [Actinoallomurus sp.]